MPGHDFTNLDFRLVDGDSVFRKYEKSRLEVVNGDSILYKEFFNADKYWYVDRYEMKHGKPYLSGWQQEFDVSTGKVLTERLCAAGNRKCNYVKKYAYYPGGNILSTGFFDKNKQDSLHYFYYGNRQLRQIVQYDHGKLMNILAYYDQDGNILDPGTLKGGEGKINVYSMNGRLIQIKEIHKGKVKKTTDFGSAVQ